MEGQLQACPMDIPSVPGQDRQWDQGMHGGTTPRLSHQSQGTVGQDRQACMEGQLQACPMDVSSVPGYSRRACMEGQLQACPIDVPSVPGYSRTGRTAGSGYAWRGNSKHVLWTSHQSQGTAGQRDQGMHGGATPSMSYGRPISPRVLLEIH